MNKVYKNIDFFTLVESELQEEGSVRIRIKGVSMQPLLRNDKDEVLLTKNFKEIIKDSIYLFKYKGTHYLHRNIGYKNGHYLFKGDNTIIASEHCPKEDIIAVVEKVYKNDKEINFQSPYWKLRKILRRIYCKTKHLAIRAIKKVK